MALVFDIILIICSASACVFCVTLSRRLKSFADKDSPLCTNIAAMSKATEETKESIKSVTNEASEVAAELRVAMSAASDLKGKLNALTGPSLGKLDAELFDLRNELRKTIDQCRFVMAEVEEQTQKQAASTAPLHQFRLSSISHVNSWKPNAGETAMGRREKQPGEENIKNNTHDYDDKNQFWVLDDNIDRQVYYKFRGQSRMQSKFGQKS